VTRTANLSFVVVEANPAGALAARTLRDEGFDGRVVLGGIASTGRARQCPGSSGPEEPGRDLVDPLACYSTVSLPSTCGSTGEFSSR
jgi:hypothetical protein